MAHGGKRAGAGRPRGSAKASKARRKTAGKSKQSKKKPLQTSAKRKLTPRQGKLLQGIAELKSQEQAAREAGYAPSTARNAHRILEGAKVREEFQDLLRKYIDPDKLGQRIADGLDAMETKHAQFEGSFSDHVDQINWAERRAYIEMASKYTGYHVDKQEVAVAHDLSKLDPAKRLEELFAAVAARTSQPDDGGRAN